MLLLLLAGAGTAAVTPQPQAHLGVLRGLPVQYADLNTRLRGLGVEYEPVGGQQYVSLPPQHRGL